LRLIYAIAYIERLVFLEYIGERRILPI